MIVRNTHLAGTHRRRHRDGAVSYHATVVADGVEVTFTLTAAEYELAERALANKTTLVLAVSPVIDEAAS